MTVDQSRTLDLFRALCLEEREALLPQLALAVEVDDFSAEELAEIEAGIAEADRGEVVDAEEALNRIAARYNFPHS